MEHVLSHIWKNILMTRLLRINSDDSYSDTCLDRVFICYSIGLFVV